MKENTILLVVVAAAVGLGIYAVTRPPAQPPQQQQQQQPPDEGQNNDDGSWEDWLKERAGNAADKGLGALEKWLDKQINDSGGGGGGGEREGTGETGEDLGPGID